MKLPNLPPTAAIAFATLVSILLWMGLYLLTHT